MKTGIVFTLFILLSSQLIFSAPDSIPGVKYTFYARLIRVFQGQKWAERYETWQQSNEYIKKQEFQKAVDFMTAKLSTVDTLENDYKMHTAGYIYGLRGFAQYRLTNYEVAMSDVNRAIEIVPKWSQGYYHRGLIHYQLGAYQAASDDYTQAIELKHKNKRKVDLIYYFDRGNAYMIQTQYENAIADYTKCIKLNSKWVWPYLNRGSARQVLQDKPGAFADFKKAIELDPYLISGYSSLGMMYYKQKDYDAAINVIMNGLDHIPDNPYLFQMAGGYYLEKGDNTQAISYFTKSIEINSNDSLGVMINGVLLRPLIGTSVAYYKLGDKENARKYFEQASEMQPFFDNAMEGLDETTKKCSPFLEQEKKTLRLMVEEF